MRLRAPAPTAPTTVGALAVLAAALFLTGCAAESPAADGTIVDLHLTRASVESQCEIASPVAPVETCEDVAVPDQCFAFVENTEQDYFVRAEVWCDAYDDLAVGDAFSDGTDVIDATCAYTDENGRWTLVSAGDCAEYTEMRDAR